MNTSIFAVAGPIMIGPSSSHTAGAAKLGRVARQIINEPFDKVEFYLYGSFDKTGKGHGTDKALLAGIMGIREDDERIIRSFEIAKEKGIEFSFGKIDLDNVHENTVKIVLLNKGKEIGVVQGSSIGGGEIEITNIDGYSVKISGNLNTIFVRQEDKAGVIGHISSILADANINIATMRVSRLAKNKEAMCIIEVDDKVKADVVKKLMDYPVIKKVKVIEVK